MPSVLILGASSDMAVATAHQFASQAYDLLLAVRQPESITALSQDLTVRYGVQAEVYAFEATDFASHQAFYEGLRERPAISICVFGSMTDETSALENWEEARQMIETNYSGAVSILNIIARDYIRAGRGTIVGISSVAGERGRKSKLIYGSAKAGFTAYLSGLRNLAQSSGVHVLTIKPGFVHTRMTEGLSLPPLLTAQPEAVANAIYRGYKKKKNVIYVKWFWKYIMWIIKLIPERFFKKMNL
ncbi:MAG: SDR family oxidoreductase [Cyclobacteriaceae bacterium]